LIEDIFFPDPNLADDDGLVAVGGDLSTHRLLKAYEMGIFPWFDEQGPVLWWSPNPRLILIPSEIKISRSLKSIIKKRIFEVAFDRDFEAVIKNCADLRRSNHVGTWITKDMIDAYCKLYDEGYAHSVECWFEGQLVGGLYGVSLGRVFFGESMFCKQSNSSKIALVSLCERLIKWNFTMIDCQVVTRHLISMGAKTVSREDFLKLLNYTLRFKTIKGNWSE